MPAKLRLANGMHHTFLIAGLILMMSALQQLLPVKSWRILLLVISKRRNRHLTRLITTPGCTGIKSQQRSCTSGLERLGNRLVLVGYLKTT